MKKIILLLVSGLLIACMAGSALANPAFMNINPDPITYGSSSTGSAVVTIYQLASQTNHRMIKLCVSDPSMEVRVHGLNFDSGWVNPPTGNPDTVFASPSSIFVPDYNPATENHITFVAGATSYPNSVPYTMEVRGPKAGEITIKDSFISAEDNKFDSCSASPRTNVPEFPTVALPVAGVLGLLFVFGRKKEGL